MKRFFLYACIWSPGALAVVGFLIAFIASRRVFSGDLTYIDACETVFPWVWIPCFLLVPAFFLGFCLLIKAKWMELLQLVFSIGLVFAWILIMDSGSILKERNVSEQVVAPDGE